MARGPFMMLTVSSGDMAMGKSLVQWFVYLLAIGVCCAYIAGRDWHSARPTWPCFASPALPPSWATRWRCRRPPSGTRRNWRMTVVTMIDGLVFALLTGGMFGWLWPR